MGSAVAALGLFNLLALLLLAAHGVTVGIARARQRATAPPGPHGSTVPVGRWAAAAGAAVVVLSPLMLIGFQQRRQISWLARPGPHAVAHLVISFAGSVSLLPPVILLAAVGVIVGMASRPAAEPGVAAVAVPWLVVPGVILIAVSQIHPVFDARYIVFCLPALALLTAAGLAGVTRLATLGAMAGGGQCPGLAAGRAAPGASGSAGGRAAAVDPFRRVTAGRPPHGLGDPGRACTPR